MTGHRVHVVIVATCLVGLATEEANGDQTEGINGNDLFFPYTPKESESENIEKTIGNQEPSESVKINWSTCTRGSFVNVNGKVHELHDRPDDGRHITEEEIAAGFEEGVCQMEAIYKSYNMLKDTYADHHATKKKKCHYRSLEEANRTLTENKKEFRFNIHELEEPEHYQNVVLVVYNCKRPKFLSRRYQIFFRFFRNTPHILLRHGDARIWELKDRILSLKNDGTTEHVQNLRKAGCLALGSFVMTMYKNQPMANTTAIKYNCPVNIDGYEKRRMVRGTVKYVRKWRKDWAADNCFPTISKTQLDKNGDLQTITATNFQSDEMKLHWPPTIQTTNIGKTILEEAKAFLSKFPEVKIRAHGGDISKKPSFVRRYFDEE